jgi:hypothetical protein
MGIVVFDPVADGKLARSVELTHILHVPDLCSNFISCLYLTHVKGLIMVAQGRQIRFSRSNTLLFTASSLLSTHPRGWYRVCTESGP